MEKLVKHYNKEFVGEQMVKTERKLEVTQIEDEQVEDGARSVLKSPFYYKKIE